jgi:hypothetical protein
VERRDDPELPPNPKLSSGTRLLYLGRGRRQLIGRATGNRYFVSDHRRKLTVAMEDAPGLMGKDVIPED